jgi:ketosteroid isomerase-like protein
VAAETTEQVVRRGYAAWNSADFDQFIATVHPDVVWETSGMFPGLRPAYSGHEGIREFWDTWTEPWDSIQIEIEKVVSLDADSVLVMVHFRARGRDGIEVELSIPNHLVVRDGMLLRFRAFRDWDEAVEAVGAGAAD